MYNLNYLNQSKLDVSILQSRTVNEISKVLTKALESENKDELIAVNEWLIKQIANAKLSGNGRKANTIEKR